LLGLAGEFIGANTAARQQALRLELPLLEALLLGRMSGDLPQHTDPDLRMSGDLPQYTDPDLRMSGDLPQYTDPDLRSPQPQPLMAGRAMATAQGPPRTP
jgi:hypothetical protein